MATPGTEAGQPECGQCGGAVAEDAFSCPYCGGLFVTPRPCVNHPDREAGGVCVLCGAACCDLCGGTSVRIFLCASHRHYEIFEGMVRVFGSTDRVQAEYVRGRFQEEGLHPFLYSRVFNPLPDASPFLRFPHHASRNPWELKVLVPAPEVARAEEILTDLELMQ